MAPYAHVYIKKVAFWPLILHSVRILRAFQLVFMFPTPHVTPVTWYSNDGMAIDFSLATLPS